MPSALWWSQKVPTSRDAISALATPALSTLWGAQRPFELPGTRLHQELTRAELFERICVRDPFFALREVRVLGAGSVVAQVPVEQAPDGEASPINVAEAGRHLAVLGSCAASLVNKPGQHYYLARRGTLERLHDGPLPRAAGPLQGTATAELKERRNACANMLLATAEGQPLYAMSVDYNVLPATAFHHLFQGVRQDMRREPRTESSPWFEPASFEFRRQNPYRSPPPLTGLEREGECLRATLGPVGTELCKGHFALHPVLPVTMVMSGLSMLAGTLLRQLVGSSSARYLVSRCEVRAESLAYPGETLLFDAHRQVVRGRDHYFDCWASVDRRVVGTMALTLTCLE